MKMENFLRLRIMNMIYSNIMKYLCTGLFLRTLTQFIE